MVSSIPHTFIVRLKTKWYHKYMGRYYEQTESRSELQQRIAAEMRARAEAKSKIELPKHDEIEDSAYVEGTKRTTSLAPVWLLIFFAAVVVFVYFFTQISH